MSDFFAMGGYALFVWSAWGVSAASLVGLTVFAIAERRSISKRLERLKEDDAA